MQLRQILEKIDIPTKAADIYLRLLETGEASARDLAEYFGCPRPSIYDMLEILERNGLVVEHDEDNIKRFRVDDPRNIEQLLKEKIESLNACREHVSSVLSSIKTSHSIQPRIRFYKGKEGLQQILRSILWRKGIAICSMWPSKELIELLTPEYFSFFNKERVRQHISVRSIWLPSSLKGLERYPFIGVGEEHLRTARKAPARAQWKTAHLIYEDTVAFLSSSGELFGFTIQSKDFAELMRTQFEAMWGLSTPLHLFPSKRRRVGKQRKA